MPKSNAILNVLTNTTSFGFAQSAPPSAVIPARSRAPMLLMTALFAVCCWLLPADTAQAQFRNQGMQISVGYLGLGSLVDPVLGPSWNMTDQPTIGAGYQFAIGYNLWFEAAHLSIGGGTIRISEKDIIEPVFSFNVATGLRYNFLQERFRPFVSAHLNYLHIISVTENAPVPTNALLGNAPFWVGARLGGGFEYYVFDEQSVMLHAGLAAFTGLNTPPPGGKQSFILPSSTVRLSYQVYF